MAKIFVLIGKSASGKDTLYKKLLSEEEISLKRIILYTTRPIRSGEKQGREYYFVNEADMAEFERKGRMIEHRVYHTIYGPWHYFTVDDGQIDLNGQQPYLAIDTLEGYVQLVQYFGSERVVPLYIEVEDGLRLSRALKRERMQKQPKYAELCRRFLADLDDFSEEKLSAAGITKRFDNTQAAECMKELKEEIKYELSYCINT